MNQPFRLTAPEGVPSEDRKVVLAYLEAIEEATRAGLLPLLWLAFSGLAEVQRARGQHDDAAGTARQAREIIERLVASVSDERLRATFQQSVKVQRVMSLAGP